MSSFKGSEGFDSVVENSVESDLPRITLVEGVAGSTSDVVIQLQVIIYQLELYFGPVFRSGGRKLTLIFNHGLN